MVRRHVADSCADSVPVRPVRTCVGCRQRAGKHDLLRVVAGGSDQAPAVVPDPGGRAPGRGAHLHATPECLDLAVRRRAFPRALRVQGPLSSTPLRDYLHELEQQREHVRD